VKLRTPEAPPKHHPSIETLTAYAAGTLRAGFDVVVAAHVHGCMHCRAEVSMMEGVGGAMLQGLEEAALADDALSLALASLDTPAPPPAPARTLEQLIASAKKRWVAPGVWVAKVDTPRAPEDRVYMLSAKPGAVTAMHGHAGLEFTQILSGALDDEGVVYRLGDFTERDDSHVHHPHATGDEPCVCLFATHGRLAPTGLLGRIAFALADV
jgi:putative transcriptional regulator